MHWNVIPSRWTPWFRPDYSSYIGSGDDGPGDPHTGYAPYDFGSIMHYDARGNRFDTIPPEKETCSFETSCTLWKSASYAKLSWWRRSGRTPSGETMGGVTGPSQAADGKYYLYLETSLSCPGYTAVLES